MPTNNHATEPPITCLFRRPVTRPYFLKLSVMSSAVATLVNKNNVMTLLKPLPMFVDVHMKIIGMTSGAVRAIEPAVPISSVALTLFQIS